MARDALVNGESYVYIRSDTKIAFQFTNISPLRDHSKIIYHYNKVKLRHQVSLAATLMNSRLFLSFSCVGTVNAIHVLPQRQSCRKAKDMETQTQLWQRKRISQKGFGDVVSKAVECYTTIYDIYLKYLEV
jgi:hypothetical protein